MRTRTRSFILGGMFASLVAVGCQVPPSAGIKAPKVVERVGSVGVHPDASMNLRFESDCPEDKGAYGLQQVAKKPLDPQIAYFKIKITGDLLVEPIILPAITREKFKDDCVLNLEVLDLPPGEYKVLMNVYGDQDKVLGWDEKIVTVRNDGTISELILRCNFKTGKLQIKIDCCDPLPTPTPCISPTPTPPCVCPTPSPTATPTASPSATPTPVPTPSPCSTHGTMTNGHNIAVDADTGEYYVSTTGIPAPILKFNADYSQNQQFNTGIGFYWVALGLDKTLWAHSGDRLYHLAANGTQIGTYAQFTGAIQQIAIAPDGAVWFTMVDNPTSSVVRRNADGSFTQFPVASSPRGIAFDKNGKIWVACGQEIQRLSATGTFELRFDPTPPATGSPLFRDIVVADDNSIWVAASGQDRVYHLNSTNGTLINSHTLAPIGQVGGDGPTGIAIDGKGDILVSNANSRDVVRLDSNGNYIQTYDCVDDPQHMAKDKNGVVLVPDHLRRSVVAFPPRP